MKHWRVLMICILGAGLCTASSMQAQQSCPPPQISKPDASQDFFDDKQETDLGDAISEQVQRRYLVIDDEDLTANLQRIGDKLLAQAPPIGMKVRFFLADFPEANALTLPGGRIYVSRKLVAMTQSEDELAGVLGHELGHVLTRQPAMTYSQVLRNVLNITHAGTREEIYRNFEQVQDNMVKKRKAFERSVGEKKGEQEIADQVGIQLVSRAGYATKAFADFFDRLTENKGKKGNWLSDFFGATKPDSKRFRELLRQTPALTAGCTTSGTAPDNSKYAKWQTTVVSYVGLGHREKLSGVISTAKLDPPLQSGIRQIRFSPDGKYLLAQGDATIYVMTREPFATLFTIYAPDANGANFTPDSESIVFHTDRLRVESWSVTERARNFANELTVVDGCQETELSPDGNYLACFSNSFDLMVYDTSSGEQVYQKKNFYTPSSYGEWFWMEFLMLITGGRTKIVEMHFSPDEKYFVAGARDTALGLNLETMQTISLPGQVKALVHRDFAFVGPDKLIGVDSNDGKNSGLVSFPSGEMIHKVALGSQRLEAATNRQYLLLRPVKDYAVGVLDLKTYELVSGSEKEGLDIFGDEVARERVDGDLGILSISAKKEIKRTKLPEGQLGTLKAFAISPNLRWMAISEKSRGGLWDLLQGKRVFHVRGFNSATISKDGVVEADFPKYQKMNRSMAQLDPATGQIDANNEIKGDEEWQFGEILLQNEHKSKNGWERRNTELSGLDAKSNAALWSRAFPKEEPQVISHRQEGNLVFSWRANSEGAKLEIKNNAELSARWPKMDAGNEDYFLEVVSPKTGKVLGAAIVRTGKGAFRVERAESVGDWLVAADSSNRLLVYSLKTGEQKGILFGRKPALSPDGEWMTAENERGELSLYRLSSLERQERYMFTSPIAYSYFAEDKRRLFVLTGNQTAYFLELPKQEAKSVN